MKNIKLIAVVGIALIMLGANSCRSNNKSRKNWTSQNQQRRMGQRKTPAQIIANMDRNNDGKLSADEVRGRLKNDFAKVDTNGDGFLTKAEIANAPRPNRNQRGGMQAPPMRR